MGLSNSNYVVTKAALGERRRRCGAVTLGGFGWRGVGHDHAVEHDRPPLDRRRSRRNPRSCDRGVRHPQPSPSVQVVQPHDDEAQATIARTFAGVEPFTVVDMVTFEECDPAAAESIHCASTQGRSTPAQHHR
jgi:hypothetical protein